MTSSTPLTADTYRQTVRAELQARVETDAEHYELTDDPADSLPGIAALLAELVIEQRRTGDLLALLLAGGPR